MTKKLPASVSDEAIRAAFRNFDDQLGQVRRDANGIAERVQVLESAPPPAGSLTDNVPREVTFIVPYTLFSSTVATTVTVTIANLPAGVKWTHVWIEPVTLFVSANGSVWTMSVVLPATGVTAAGTVKTGVDVTTPSSLSQQAGTWYMQTDRSSPVTLEITIDSGGGDTADLLTQGEAAVHLLLSVPGSSASTLPPS